MSKGKAAEKVVRTLLQREGKQKKPIMDDKGKPVGRDKTTPESKDARAPKSKQTKKQVKTDTAAKARIGKAKDVKREINIDAKRRGDKSVKQERDTRPKVNTLSKIDQKEAEYDKFAIGVQRGLISKQRKGEPATYKGKDYSDVLSKRKGIKPQVTKKKVGGDLKQKRIAAAKRAKNKIPLSEKYKRKLEGLRAIQEKNKNRTLKKESQRKLPAKGLGPKRKSPQKGLRGMGAALRGGGKVSKR